MQAIIPVLRESELAAHGLELAGKSLLQHAIDVAKRAQSISAVVVQTRDPKVAKLAESLGAQVHDPAQGATREAHVLMSLHYPFRTAANIDQLHNTDASMVTCVTRHRHHPVGTFVAKKGRMDFSQTLDSPEWRGIDEKQYFQAAPSLSLHYAPGSKKRAYLILDDVSALTVYDAKDLPLAQAVIEQNANDKEALWKSL